MDSIVTAMIRMCINALSISIEMAQNIHCCPRRPGQQGQEHPTWMLSS